MSSSISACTTPSSCSCASTKLGSSQRSRNRTVGSGWWKLLLFSAICARPLRAKGGEWEGGGCQLTNDIWQQL